MTAWVGIFIVLCIHAAMRFVGLFGPAEMRPLILGSFLLLWLTPFILLDRDDRRAIGLFRLGSPTKLALSVFTGAVIAALVFIVGFAFYGLSADHPYSSVRDSYLSGVIPPLEGMSLFALFTIPAVIFSPIGEEFFCRGVIVRRGEKTVGYPAGVFLSALVFSALHIFHHGIVRVDGAWGYIGWSGVFWFGATFAISAAFSMLRRWSGTIWSAVLAHSGFNLVMNAFIFSLFVR
jgi:membrane protease YdiL (CAAX protease family)